MVQMSLIISMLLFNMSWVFCRFLYWYMWFIFLLNYYINMTFNYSVMFFLKYKKWSTLMSPKCYKSSQISMFLQKSSFLMYGIINQMSFFNYMNFMSYMKMYVIFFSLFITLYNCYLVSLIFIFSLLVFDFKYISNKMLWW